MLVNFFLGMEKPFFKNEEICGTNIESSKKLTQNSASTLLDNPFSRPFAILSWEWETTAVHVNENVSVDH